MFQWPGIGRMLVQAISTRDILLVQGGVLVIAVAYVFINLVTDLIQSMLDPRIGRHDGDHSTSTAIVPAQGRASGHAAAASRQSVAAIGRR